ncbi:MAG: ABC transporter substrate-binding protein [Nocardioidaceae bacterium]
MSRNRHTILAIGGSAVLVASLAACGSGSSGGSSNTSGPGTSALKGQSIVIGTTDTVTSLDPAGAYDEGSWTLMYNMYQTLVTIPPGQNAPQGDAAKSCTYNNPKTLTCVLKPGLKFSNGDPLTSTDVKFSIDRNIRINDPNGAAILLSSIANTDKQGNLVLDPNAIATPNATTVVFHLKRPDTVFESALTTPAGDIVDHKVYPADKLMSGTTVVGSGPYELTKYTPGQLAGFQANPYYSGVNKAQAPSVLVNYYTSTSALKLAVQNGEVDVAWRSLAPADLKSLESDKSVTVATGAGSEIRYWVWKVNGPVGKNIAIRKAAAYLINRQQIAQVAYDGTVDPLYSIVPPGFAGQTNSFAKLYGTTPSKAKAQAVLSAAHVKTPINLTLAYTPSHYGPNSVDEATQLQRQLDGSGLFTVTLKSAEWTQYQSLYKQGAYDLFELGWFPDYLDADDYLAPFLVNGGFYANGYKNATVNRLVAQEEATSNKSTREGIFVQLQNIAAQDVPFIPSWVGKNTAVYGPGVKGVQSTLDPSFIFRFWMLSKNA